MRKVSYLFNPFEKIAGLKALLFGLGFTLIICNIYAIMGFSQRRGIDPSYQNFFNLFVCELIPPGVLSMSFYILGLVFSKSKIRFIDVLGSLAFCKIALICVCLIYPLAACAVSGDLYGKYHSTFSLILGVFIMAFMLLFLAWYLILIYGAVRVSCNLKGARLFIIYMLVMPSSWHLSALIQDKYISVFSKFF